MSDSLVCAPPEGWLLNSHLAANPPKKGMVMSDVFLDRLRSLTPRVIRREEVVAVTCDTCWKMIGYAYENDLNGTYFFCDVCYTKLPAEDRSDLL